PDDRQNGLTILLRRLANPHLPYDPNPSIGATQDLQANPRYNPYVTIDYVEGVAVHAAGSGVYASQGQMQPYAAARGQIKDQTAAGAGTANTFGRQNDPAPMVGKYDWLVHLDRPLVSPMELLHVAACPPSQLTQMFATGGLGSRAPWFDPACRLYRL